MLPFTPGQFLAVFADYNHAVWPAQIVAYLLGGLAVVLLFLNTAGSDRAIAAILAAMWLWTGLCYRGVWFSAINQAYEASSAERKVRTASLERAP